MKMVQRHLKALILL